MEECPSCKGRLTIVRNIRRNTISYRCNQCRKEFSDDGQEKEKVYDLGSDYKLMKTFHKARKGLH